MKELKVLEYLKKEINFLSNAISYNEQNGVSTDHLKINLSRINEVIKELEELNNRSCDKCKYWHKKGFCFLLEIYSDIGGCGSHYEPKQ